MKENELVFSKSGDNCVRRTKRNRNKFKNKLKEYINTKQRIQLTIKKNGTRE